MKKKRKMLQPINEQCLHHIETCQLISRVRQWTHFHMMETSVANRFILILRIKVRCIAWEYRSNYYVLNEFLKVFLFSTDMTLYSNLWLKVTPIWNIKKYFSYVNSSFMDISLICCYFEYKRKKQQKNKGILKHVFNYLWVVYLAEGDFIWIYKMFFRSAFLLSKELVLWFFFLFI